MAVARFNLAWLTNGQDWREMLKEQKKRGIPMEMMPTLPRNGAHVIWLEAETFADPGGWVNDSQFVNLMGSPYLLAHGMGKPVADAKTTVTIAQRNNYRLWVRTKDWFPTHHPGRFQIHLNSQPVSQTFGQSGRPGWRWEDGGIHELSGNVEIRLHDLTGYDGRCDVLLLTNDLAFEPPGGKEAIALYREKHGGVSGVTAMPEYDVVVVGGGLAGCTAAVAAARNGARVALVQDRPVLGGNASSEILVPPVGIWPHGKQDSLNPRETGLVEEYRTAGNQRVSEGKLYEKRLHRFVELESNVDLHLNAHATDVEMASDTSGQIKAVVALEVNTGRRLRFVGNLFIDCTGDAVVGVAAGAEYRHGKEPKSMYNEPWAPDEPSPNTMGNGLKYASHDRGEPQPFDAPEWSYEFPSCDDFCPGRHPRFNTGEAIGYQWEIELGGLRDTYADAEEIRDDLLRLIFGLWDHVKNRCPQFRDAAANHGLAWLGHVAGKRENRRLIGDYVLTQNDIGAQTLFPDRVAYGGWVVDDHHSAGFFHDGSFGRHQDDPEHAYQGVEFSIPFRSLYSRNITNLLMAGRNISASHLAMSDTRVMLTCAIMGHAVGTGAAMCVCKAMTPRELCKGHIGELQQQLLKEGAHIIDMPGKDTDDLARAATLTASSERKSEDGELMLATNAVNGMARATEMASNAWVPCDDIVGPHWLKLAWSQPVALNTVHIVFQMANLAPQDFRVDVWEMGGWRTIAAVGHNRHRRHVLGFDQTRTSLLRIVLDQPAGICEVRVYHEPQHLVEMARRAHHNMRQPDVGPFLPFQVERKLPALEGIVVDSNHAICIGAWVTSTWSQPYIGDGYLHDGDADKGGKWVIFEPELSEPGMYEVRLSYVAYHNRATNTPVTIYSADGPKTVHINQREAPPISGLFISLGKHQLRTDAKIVVRNAGTDGYAIVDAVQFIPE